MQSKNPLVVIIGPTAVGKTSLSLRIAADFDVEIVSADSRQIYRGCDIGTAKPSPAELNIVPHHLIDVVDPDQILSLADFQERAYAAVDEIQRRGRLPLLVGGTGQWVKAVVEGWRVPRVPPDPALRAILQARVEANDPETLHRELAAVDPVAAAKIDRRNIRRVIRALEVYYKTGQPISALQTRIPPTYRIAQIGLTMPRELLYRRIDERIEKMMAQGLLAEVTALAEAGYNWNMPALMSLGYKQLGQYLRGENSLNEAVALIKKETRRLVRQQYNWFSLDDRQIYWFDVAEKDQYASIKALIYEKLVTV